MRVVVVDCCVAGPVGDEYLQESEIIMRGMRIRVFSYAKKMKSLYELGNQATYTCGCGGLTTATAGGSGSRDDRLAGKGGRGVCSIVGGGALLCWEKFD